MMRTFAHEFTHFLEKWSPMMYNDFQRLVFETLTEKGVNVDELIADKQRRSDGMDYAKASREVVAEAMVDILPDTDFARSIAEQNRTLFEKLLEKLKEFVHSLREHFGRMHPTGSTAANALKEQIGGTLRYMDSVVSAFDKIAIDAVEAYQRTVGNEVSSDGMEIKNSSIAKAEMIGEKEYGKEREEREKNVGRADRRDAEVHEGAPSQTGERSRVQEGVRGASEMDRGESSFVREGRG